MEHRSKKELQTLQKLLNAMLEIENMSKEEQSLIDKNMKLMGSDLRRNIQELMQGPQNYLHDIEIPDLKNPKAVKTFLYAMQSAGRRGRDSLNIVPSWMSKYWTQHHGDSVLGVGSLNTGVTNISDAIDNGNRFEDVAGKPWGTTFENLWEILSNPEVHRGTAHRGNYNDPKQAVRGNGITELWANVPETSAYNVANANAADNLQMNKDAKAFNQLLATEGGATSNDIYTTENTQDKTAIVRKQVTTGANNFGIKDDINKNNFEVVTKPETRQALLDARNPSLSYKQHQKAMKVLKGAGLFGAAAVATEILRTANAGDMEGAKNLAIQAGADIALGDIPVVGDMVSPEGVADGTLTGASETHQSIINHKNTWELVTDKAKEMKENVAYKNNPNDYGITEALGINGPNQLGLFKNIQGFLSLTPTN